MIENWTHFENNEKPKVLIAGVGGAGINILNTLISENINGVEFIALNTDSQSLMASKASLKVPLGTKLTRGFGTGGNPEIGKQSALENLDALKEYFKQFSLIFFVGGLGGGTGSGALPVLSKLASDEGILNVSIITQPFEFEGEKRKQISNDALRNLKDTTSSYVVIPNENFFAVFDNNVPITEAFLSADRQIAGGIKGITDIINTTGQINLDFADIKSILDNGGQIMVNSTIVSGQDKVNDAIEKILENHLIDKGNATSAKQVLLQISGGNDITLSQIKEIMEKIKGKLKAQENFVFGTNFSGDMNGQLILSLIATGLNSNASPDKNFKNISDYLKTFDAPKFEPTFKPVEPEIVQKAEETIEEEPVIEIKETVVEFPIIEEKEEFEISNNPFEFKPIDEAQEEIEETFEENDDEEIFIEEDEIYPVSVEEVIIEEVDGEPVSIDISSMSFGGAENMDDKKDSFSDKLKNIFSHKNEPSDFQKVEKKEEPKKTMQAEEKKEQASSYDLMDLFRDVPSLNENEEDTFESFLKEQNN